MADIEAIWDDFGNTLKHFILKRVSDRNLAEDILQEVFVKIQSRIGTLRDAGKIQPWIYQITRNTITDHFRAKKVMVELPPTLQAPQLPMATKVSDDLTPCIQRMVDRLPEKYRQAVVMTTYQGMTQREMSEELGISLSGAKSRVQRARAKLRDMLMDCCTFELDRLGTVISYESRRRSGCPSPAQGPVD